MEGQLRGVQDYVVRLKCDGEAACGSDLERERVARIFHGRIFVAQQTMFGIQRFVGLPPAVVMLGTAELTHKT
jgi:hypothetical protein